MYAVFIVMSSHDILAQAISLLISLFIFMTLIAYAIGLDEKVILIAGLFCSAIYPLILLTVDKIMKFVFLNKTNL
ncbi:MAG: hypothetical protein EHM20_03395 [Alphaproteobacteria bacterium]|nr:MAG: hypothetical protein EHM20_03395 [Alphaproteobacteria bacterium]